MTTNSNMMANLLTPQEALQALIDGQEVEYRNCMGEWCDLNLNTSCVRSLVNKSAQFRIKSKKQEILTVGGVSFPKPYQGEMEYGTIYYYPMISYEAMWGVTKWTDCEFDKSILSRNLVHLTKENAIAHAKALIKLSGGQYE